MPVSFSKFSADCLRKALVGGCLQLYITDYILYIVLRIRLPLPLYETSRQTLPFILYSDFFIPKLVVLCWLVLFGLINGVVVCIVYWLFYNLTGSKTRLMAATTSLILCSSTVLLFLTSKGQIAYLLKNFPGWWVLYWLGLVLNILWLNRRLAKRAEQLLENSKPVASSGDLTGFPKVRREDIIRYIQGNYLRFNRYELDTRLLELGYEAAEIEAVWTSYLPPKQIAKIEQKSVNWVVPSYYALNLVLTGAVLFRVIATAKANSGMPIFPWF